MGKVTWFYFLANYVHSALCILLSTFRILPIPVGPALCIMQLNAKGLSAAKRHITFKRDVTF